MRAFFIILFFVSAYTVKSQNKTAISVAASELYNPSANAKKEIQEAIAKAKQQNKHVLIKAGGNWCSLCIEFDKFCRNETQVDSLIRADYIVSYLNYSEENYNDEIFALYGYPQRLGFPVFIILDGNGNRLHTQSSEYLEQGRSYNKRKVMGFLQAWNKDALNPALYKRTK
jgi:thioredoxin-related protein